MFVLGPMGYDIKIVSKQVYFQLWTIKKYIFFYVQQHEQMDNTSALDYKEGKDMQGIPWERLNYTRDQYRQMRLKEYKSYQNLTRSRSGLEQVISLVTFSCSAFGILVKYNFLYFVFYVMPDMFVFYM